MNEITMVRNALLMSLNQAIVDNSFKTTWNMTAGNFTLSSQTGTYNCTIDWGDGTAPTQHTTGNPTHTYSLAGQYQISISGSYSGTRMDSDVTNRTKLISVDNWGNVGFTSFNSAFNSCSNLSKLPNGSITGANNVTSFDYVFANCTSLTSIPIGLFDNCSNVTSFYSCFVGCSSLTSIPVDLFKYNVNVTSFYYCFGGCKRLSLPIALFNLSALQNKQPNMTLCFYVKSTSDSPIGTTQALWSYITISSNNSCFLNCTALSNYASIPALWK